MRSLVLKMGPAKTQFAETATAVHPDGVVGAASLVALGHHRHGGVVVACCWKNGVLCPCGMPIGYLQEKTKYCGTRERICEERRTGYMGEA